MNFPANSVSKIISILKVQKYRKFLTQLGFKYRYKNMTNVPTHAGAVCLVYDLFYCSEIDMAELINFKLRLKSHRPHGHQRAETRSMKPFLARFLAITLFTALFMLLRVWIMGTMPTFYQ